MTTNNSKEDILSKKDGYYSHGFDGSTTPIYEAMEEYASIRSREEAIGFKKWMNDNYIESPRVTIDPVYYELKDYYTNKDLTTIPKYTTEYLYELYQKSKPQ